MMHVMEMITEPPLVSQQSGSQPFYSEDGINLVNPAVGYPSQMLASVCSHTPDAYGRSCLWSHGATNSIEVVDNE